MVHPSRFCQFWIRTTTATWENYLVDLQSTTFQQVILQRQTTSEHSRTTRSRSKFKDIADFYILFHLYFILWVRGAGGWGL